MNSQRLDPEKAPPEAAQLDAAQLDAAQLDAAQLDAAQLEAAQLEAPAATATNERQAGLSRGWRPWLWALLLCLPFWLVWLGPVFTAAPHTVVTGFPQYDQPYYFANGRAIFERGNGLAGPNPYDPDPAAPNIYFHLLTWLFGLVVVGLRLDPGLVYVVTGLAAGLLFARLSLALLERLVHSRRSLWLLFPLLMWGGGVASAAFFLLSQLHLLKEGMSSGIFEPSDGWWFLYWGRNLIYSTEAVYHCLVLAILLAFLDRQWWRFTLFVALIAVCHPFTGAQILLGVGAWVGLNLFFPATTRLPRLPAAVMTALALVAAAFAAYYGLFLPRFPSHVALTKVWALNWQERPIETLCAYLPLAIAVFLAARRGLLLAGPERLLFGIFAAVTLVLTHHGYFAPPHQPLHFSHGYLFLPLFLLALPLLEKAADWLLAGSMRRRLLAVLVVIVAAADNLTFLSRAIHSAEGDDVRAIDSELREIYRQLDASGTDAMLVSNDPIAGYLAATYSRVRPFFGHAINTPQRTGRLAELKAFFSQGRQGPNIAAVRLLLLEGQLPPGQKEWAPLFVGERWSLYSRRP